MKTFVNLISMHLISALILPAILWSCAERRAENPFDPNTTLPPPVEVRLTPYADFVDLSWSLRQEVNDYDGFRIYRAVDSLQSLQKYAELPVGQFTFRDTLLQSDTRYYYRVSIVGQGVESNLSAPRQTIVGPGVYWLLSRNGYCIKQLSYDLQYQQRDYPTAQRPASWTGSAGDSLSWYVFSDFGRGVSKFDRSDGNEEVLFFDNSVSPVDISHRSRDNTLYVLDNQGKRVLILRDDQIIDEQALDTLDNYRKVQYDSLNGQTLILGDSQLIFWRDQQPFSQAAKVSLPAGWLCRDFDLVGTRTYLMASSADSISWLMTMDSEAGTALDTLLLDGEAYRIRFDWVNDWFYVAKNTGEDHQILQLSMDGSRLFQTGGFSFIEQIAINPFNRSIIIVDSGKSTVSLIDKLGRSISSTGDAGNNLLIYSPIRILIE